MSSSAMPRARTLTAGVLVVFLVGSCSLLTSVDGLAGGVGDGGNGDGDGATSVDASTTDFIDEKLEAQFGAGSFAGTRWVGDHVELEVGAKVGDFVSRVFDASGAAAPLQSLRWVPGAPYGKALPDRGASETGYRASSFDMSKNVLLAHFDDGLVDSSPTASALSGTALGGFVPGVFGSALADTQAGYVHTTVSGSQSVFNFGTDSFSWSIWAKSTTLCSGNAVYLGIENPGTGLKPHLWLGCTPVDGDAGAQGTLGDTLCSTRIGTDDCVDAFGSAVLTNGAWHHMAIVKSGHAPVTLIAYLDGVEASSQGSFKNPIVFDDGVELAIGAFSKGTYPAEGSFDEVAIWRRALTPDEVRALYRRGAQRLGFQVRACDDPECVGVPFAGPGQDPSRSFVDPSTALGPPGNQPITAARRYVQYKAHFESDDPSQSPSLYAVTLTR